MIAIFTAFKEEVRDYLKAGRFRVAEREGFLRFYLSDLRPGIVVVGTDGNDNTQLGSGIPACDCDPAVWVAVAGE